MYIYSKKNCSLHCSKFYLSFEQEVKPRESVKYRLIYFEIVSVESFYIKREYQQYFLQW
jgi:hypothetical protein